MNIIGNIIGPHRTTRDSTTSCRDDARAEELHNLKLALATFALQLDAFEMRTRQGPFQGPFRAGMAHRIPVPPLDAVADLRGKKMIGR
jgi:hypothetical protein